MASPHPHAEATYRIVPVKEGRFGVEVTIPETFPTLVTSFASEAESAQWIADHKRQVEERSLYRRSWRARNTTKSS
jgi:hypothetical protein